MVKAILIENEYLRQRFWNILIFQKFAVIKSLKKLIWEITWTPDTTTYYKANWFIAWMKKKRKKNMLTFLTREAQRNKFRDYVFSITIDNNGKTCSLITPSLNSNDLTYFIKMLLAAALKVYDSNREWNLIAPLFVSLKSHFRDRLNRITFLPRFFK